MEIICSVKSCSKSGALRCSRCKKVNYCSKECQKADWKKHKMTCSPHVNTNERSGACDIRSKKSSGSRFSVKEEKRQRKKFRRDPGPRTNEAASDSIYNQMPREYRDMMFRMMGSHIGDRDSVAQEYERCFPLDIEHSSRIKEEEFIYRSQIMANNTARAALSDEDFNKPENFVKRWKYCLNDKEGLFKFLNTNGRKIGDIYERSHHDPYQCFFYQTMRNTSIANQVYAFGKTYVCFGYVDLFQLIWGQYQQIEAGVLTFYGYEMCQVTSLRSRLIHHMMKMDNINIGTRSILQVWFSSVLDETTLQALQSCIDDFLGNIETYQLSDEDVYILRKWKKSKIEIRKAQEIFRKGLRSGNFEDIWSMKKMEDKVKFCRNLFTGCIFLDEKEAVAGNPTMFANIHGQEKMTEELMFKAIDLKAVGFSRTTVAKISLFDMIENLTLEVTNTFRSHVQKGKIICHLYTKFVDQRDFKFAKEIRKLQPYGIDWSNIPDYVEKNEFIKFAKACSVKDTLHQMHFINWCYYVYGSVHVDWDSHQKKLNAMFEQYKVKMKDTKAMTARLSQVFGNPLVEFFEEETFMSPLNEVNLMLSIMFKQKFENFYLSDVNGKQLNRYESNVCDAAVRPFFDQSPTMFRSVFSFDEEMLFRIGDPE